MIKETALHVDAEYRRRIHLIFSCGILSWVSIDHSYTSNTQISNGIFELGNIILTKSEKDL